jgi:hypothetical protein
MQDFQAHLRTLLREAVPVAGNPLPPDELARFKGYVDTLAERPLTLEEAADLKTLAEKVAGEHPESDAAQALATAAALYLAFAEALTPEPA